MFIPFRQYSTFSILKAIGQPEDIVSEFAKYEYPAAAITEINNVFSAVKFFEACKKAKIKPILGCDLTVTHNGKRNNILCHAKNLKGWQVLIKAISEASLLEDDYIPLERLAEISNKNILVGLGSLYSEIGTNIFKEGKYDESFINQNYEEVRTFVSPDWKKDTLSTFNQYQDLFGKENVIAEICNTERTFIPATEITSKIVKSLLGEIGCKAIYTSKSHYPTKQEAENHRILLASALKTTILDFNKEAKRQGEYSLIPFYKTSNAHIPSPLEIKQTYSEEELKSNLEVFKLIEEYNILSGPLLPDFPIPETSENKDAKSYLRELCLQGWYKKIDKKIPKDKHSIYADRMKYELQVINDANLANYFLIEQDICCWAKQRMMVGPGRGSSAGSLVAYVLDITEVDPIRFGLLFERFYNAGRNSPGKVSLPDIDIDFPIEYVDLVNNHVTEKYGANRVAGITTFGKLKGKSALKEVLRVKQRCSFSEMNMITSFIPDEGKISDKLKEMEEEEGESSIIKWALENSPKLAEWCKIDENGKLDGPFSIDFQQAIELEGCVKSHGKHAAGIIISRYNLVDSCPVLKDKDGHKAGFDMGDLEKIGHVKMDNLTVKVLDDLMLTQKLMRGEC